MSVSSLQKKMSATKSLVFIFLVGLLSLAFFIFYAKADVVAPDSTSGTATVTTTFQIRFTFTTTSVLDSSTVFGFSSSTDGITWTVTTTQATTTLVDGLGKTFMFTGLATNTLYYLRAGAGDAVTSSTAPFASTTKYTLADTPGTPTLSAATIGGFTVKINSSTNPATTTYIVRDTASSTQTKYLQEGGTWGTATATFKFTQLGPVSGTSTTGLATNTLHQISVAAVNGNGVTTSYGSVASIYTLADTPAAPTLTAVSAQTLKVVVNAATNPTTASTTFVVRDTVSSTQTKYLQSDQTWGTATATFNYSQLGGASGTTTIGLATNTQHVISVAAVNGDSAATTSYGATAILYTLADTPGTPTLSSATLQGFIVTINSSTNPTSTLYIVRDTVSSTLTKYLQNDQTWGNATATFNFTQLGAAAGTTTIGLATNTLHQISMAAVNMEGVTTSYGGVASIYTLATTPGTPTLTSAAVQTLKVVVDAATNPTTASTTFVVRDTASSTLTKYLQSDSTWGNATATFNYSQLGGASGTTTLGLATSSRHVISIAAVNGDSAATTSYGTSATLYTRANTPSVPVLSAATLSAFTVVVNSSTNPASTTYIVKDTGTTTVKYLQDGGTWGTATATFSYLQLGGLSGTTTSGLDPNTLHTLSVAAINGDSTVTSSYGTTSSLYTLTNVPSSVTLSAGGNDFTLSWSGDATEYWAEDTVGNNSGWITSKSFSVSGINCGVTRTFTVAGRNGDQVVTASSSQFSATTNACGGGGSVGGGGASSPATPATPAKPAVPTVSPAVPAVPATPASVSLPSTASPVAVFVHTLGIGSKGAEVRQLQAKLRELGYFKHPTNTGLFGPATKAAVVAFQKAQGFRTAPGVVGPATRDALNSESGVSAGENTVAPAPAPSPTLGQFVSALRIGSRGAEVRMLQAKLRELGYFTYPTDTGSFGPATKAAVVAFQKDQGLSQVGFVGPGTRAALNSL